MIAKNHQTLMVCKHDIRLIWITRLLTVFFIIMLLYNYRCNSIKNCDRPWSCNRGHAHHDYLHHFTIHLNDYDFAQIQAGSPIGARSSPGQSKGTASNL